MKHRGTSAMKRYLFTWDWVPGPWWMKVLAVVAFFAIGYLIVNVLVAIT